MNKDLTPAEIFSEITQKFKNALTPEIAELYRQMERAKEDHANYHREKSRIAREASEKARIEAEELAKAKAIEEAIASAKQRETTPKIIQASPEGFSSNNAGNDSKNTLKLKQPVKTTNRQHYLLPLVTKALMAKCHVWLVGPAGSGKTTLVDAAATELNLPHTSISVCSQTTKTDLLGYVDAHGVYRSTSFREAYEHGGVFCFDEIDNGNSNVLAVLNSALSSSTTVFPDKIVQRHANFVVIACANTFGVGASGGYVGRTQIDAATLDRFFFVEMPYDEGLESHIAGLPKVDSPVWNSVGQKVPTDADWLSTVKKTREAVSKLGIKTIISPRATIMGLALIKQGVPEQFLEKGLLFKSLPEDLVVKIRQS